MRVDPQSHVCKKKNKIKSRMQVEKWGKHLLFEVNRLWNSELFAKHTQIHTETYTTNK
uniref:Uncharacterized protein n=1 Tax=Trypanosoma brucei TaxID=5691 RepID=Q583B4_9TRYP|nr:hypothetical protein, unlikely [Trypanosoma brucei]